MSFELDPIRLGDVAEIFTGYPFKGADYLPAQSGIRVVRGDNVTERSLRWGEKEKCWQQITPELKPYLLQAGDVVVGMDGSKVGKNFAWISPSDGPCLLAQRVARIRGRKDLNQTFLRYLICNPRFTQYVQSIHTGTSIPHISKRQIEDFRVVVPPMAEQLAIGALLKRIDDRISLLLESNATLEAMAKTLFKSWFVDFDPVRAKVEGREPEGLDAGTAELFSDSFEDVGSGSIPTGWHWGVLGELAQTAREQRQPSDLDDETHYVGLEHIPRQSLGLTDWGTAGGLESAKSSFKGGDVLFGKLRPYFHKVVVAPFDGVCSTDILVCRSKKEAFYGLVAMHLFSKSLVDYADRLSNGAKMPRVNWKDLAAYPIAVPPEPIADCFSKVATPLIQSIVANVLHARTLADLRDALLPRLISGQLRLPDAEALLQDAA
ncbi:restriction endonuclease subunit S (plasmid) [Paraburkholderia sp. A2RO-4L]|uniref:restriction endonuclease subunit S n=1 Tax=Paraburkholderia sp. A2RO-4L TaxID=3028374 RepID=UPI003DA9034F